MADLQKLKQLAKPFEDESPNNVINSSLIMRAILCAIKNENAQYEIELASIDFMAVLTATDPVELDSKLKYVADAALTYNSVESQGVLQESLSNLGTFDDIETLFPKSMLVSARHILDMSDTGKLPLQLTADDNKAIANIRSKGTTAEVTAFVDAADEYIKNL